MDDAQNSGPSEQELLDAVMRNSDIMNEAGFAPPPPAEEELDEDPVDYDDDTPESEEAADTEDDDAEYEEDEVEADGEDDTSTQEPDVYTADDLDLDAQVSVKIDGEEMAVSFGDLLKGYTTEQSLSKKGRELGEARKALDAERDEKIGQLDQVAQASAAVLMKPEQEAAKAYHDIEAQIKKARDDGDTFELGELKDKREQAQAKYWEAKNSRESILAQVETHKKEQAEKAWQDQIEHFNKAIPELISDFSPEVATAIREFAIEEGVAASILDTITDPSIVKFVDDYRRLKQGVSKGKAKRKAVATKKVPSKKGTPVNQKKATKKANLRDKVLSGNGNEGDEMNFLRNFASESLKNI